MSDLNGAVIKVAVVAAMGGLLFGFDTSVISGAILFIRQDFSLSDLMVELTTSVVLLGAVAGAILGGAMADRLGRRASLIAAAIVFLVATAACALANTIALLLIGRALIGVAIGVASFVSPLYISEMSPVDVRGAMVSLNQLAITAGILVAYLVDYSLAGRRDWRGMFACGILPGLGLLIGILLMPETPRWLLAHGRAAEASAVLRKVRGARDVTKEVGDILEGLKIETSGKLSDLLSPALRVPLAIGVGLGIFQQITGINTVIYYAPTIFLMAGFRSAAASIAATAGVGAVNFLMTIVSMRLLDRVGRRPLLLWSLAGMVLSLLILAASFAFVSPSSHGTWALGALTAGSLMLYIASFAVGLGPVFWLLIAEIYPLPVRGKAMSAATIANWSANFLVTATFISLTTALGRPGAFLLYALFGVLAWVFSKRLVPETKGKTLEEIQTWWTKAPGSSAR